MVAKCRPESWTLRISFNRLNLYAHKGVQFFFAHQFLKYRKLIMKEPKNPDIGTPSEVMISKSGIEVQTAVHLDFGNEL